MITCVPKFQTLSEPTDSPESIEECEIVPDILVEADQSNDRKRQLKQAKVEDFQRNMMKESLTQNKDKKETEDDEQLKIPPYFDMSCDLCNSAFDTFQEVKKHYRVKHKISKGYVKCCSNKKFYKRTNVIDHIKWHLNPNLFQ